MKCIIGKLFMSIGAVLWEKGGFWNESERYEDLSWTGKLGYNMFMTGTKLMGITLDDMERIAEQYEVGES